MNKAQTIQNNFENNSIINMLSYEVFVAVVRHKNISIAAKKLNKSPSAVSKQVSALEQKLGVQLLDRSTRAISVTEAGAQFYSRCVDILKLMEEAEGEIKETSNEPRGKINLTWPAPVSFSCIPSTLTDFTKLYPKVSLEINVDIKVQSFNESNIDFAFRLGALDDSRLIAVPLGYFQPIICASSTLIERCGHPTEISDFREFPIITQSNINIIQRGREVFQSLQKLPFNERYCVNDISTMLQLTRSHMGATILFKHMVKNELENGSLIQLMPNLNINATPLNLVYRRLDYMPKRQRSFIDFFKDVYRNREFF